MISEKKTGPRFELRLTCLRETETSEKEIVHTLGS